MMVSEALERVKRIRDNYAGIGAVQARKDRQALDALLAERKALAEENAKMTSALQRIIGALDFEINPSNYDHGDVERLNDQSIEAWQIATGALMKEPA